MTEAYCECSRQQTRNFIQKSGKYCNKCGKLFHINHKNQETAKEKDRKKHIYANTIIVPQNTELQETDAAEATTSPVYEQIENLASNIHNEITNITESLESFQWDHAAEEFITTREIKNNTT